MGSLISFLRTIDGYIQRGFDACIFFLMRTFGWRKSAIRYAMNAAVILSIAGLCMVYWQIPDTRYAIVWLAFLLAILLLGQRTTYANDLKAEERNMRSVSDKDGEGLLAGIWRFMMWYYIVDNVLQWTGVFHVRLLTKLKPASLAIAQHWAKPYLILDLIFTVFYLALLYLARTPPEPPKVEEKVLVPVTSPT